MALDSNEINGARRAISRRVVALLKEYVGRGPTHARTVIHDDLVLVLVADTLTQGERLLADEEETELVREMRRTFLRTMSEQLQDAIEAEVGRPLQALLGDHSVEPDYAFTAGLLEPLAATDGEAASTSAQHGTDPMAIRDQQRQISSGMVMLYKEFIGRGPRDVRTYIEDDIVVSLLSNTLTKAEMTLADEDRPASVAELRRQFQDTLESRARDIVGAATGREVVAFMSDHSIDPDYAIEVFVLAGSENGDGDAPAG